MDDPVRVNDALSNGASSLKRRNIESFDSAQDRYRTRNGEFRREGLRGRRQ